MKFDNTDVWGFEHSLRGMRNPLDSWSKSDSIFIDPKHFILGKNDLSLAQRLIKSGSEHRKFLRQIFVSVDITAPLYWWKEFDTYKIGTVANSCSTMHTITKNPITIDCFEMDDFNREVSDTMQIEGFVSYLEHLRKAYLESKNKNYWKELIRWLPESWLQKRTVTMNYENLYSIYRQRKGHKLTEWHKFVDWIKSLPYANELIVLEL